MPKCPQCSKEIDYLRTFSECWEEFEVSLDEDGNEQWEGPNTQIRRSMSVRNVERFCSIV